MVEFKYTKMFPLGEDTTKYRLLTKDYVKVRSLRAMRCFLWSPRPW